MNDESDDYRLFLRPPTASGDTRPVEELRAKLTRVPTLEEIDGRHFEFGEADQAGIMKLALETAADEAAGQFDRVEITVPRAWLPGRGPQVFALVFMAAEWLGWEVYDPQIEDTLKKDVVLAGMIAMRRAQLDREGER
ncbi:MAG TPA: hypothetical protein VGB13_09835 [Candidatus Krumholzibacteria bacterium]|jgi:hypothetical protein